MNYKDSGVDIELAEKFIVDLTKDIQITYDKNVIRSKNNFCGLYDISKMNLKHPILAASTDGVGSKIKLAAHHGLYYNLGLDLVFNNTNDIICSGATPLFFLDYFATGKLNPDIGNFIFFGIIDGCMSTNISLISGETAELPLTYNKGDLELVGTCIGIVDKNNLFDANKMVAGDVLIGLKSSGPHSNGFSLINRIVEQAAPSFNIIKQLLKPTVDYNELLLQLSIFVDIKGCANITGGGLANNVARILPDNLTAIVDRSLIEVPEIFNWIQTAGDVESDEMWRVFNMGVGMVICVSEDDVSNTLETLPRSAMVIGHLTKKVNDKSVLFL